MEFYRVSEAAAAAIERAGGTVTGENRDTVTFPDLTAFMGADHSDDVTWVDMPNGECLVIETRYTDQVKGGFDYVFAYSSQEGKV